MAPIAYLILTHHHPRLLAELASALDSERARLFVHVDAKSDQAPFAATLPPGPRVAYVEPRHIVSWAAFSMVEATLSLLRAARASVPTPERYVLTSGDSFPLLPTAELEARLDQPGELIEAGPMASGHPFRERLDRYHLADHPLLNRHHPGGAREHEWRALRDRVARFIDGLPPPAPLALQPHVGSQWWALSRVAVDHILAFVDDAANAELEWRFRHSHAPDETFIQTILGNSPLASSRTGGIQFADWTPEPGVRLPRVLTEASFERATASGKLFARKMDPTRSQKLLELLKAHRGQSS